jgi:putative Holliday junction resolvase
MGLKRTGIAVTDPLQIIASPLETVPTHALEVFLKAYLAKESVEAIIIGLPQDDKGIPGEMVPHIEGLIKRLGKAFPGLEIFREDERYTTRMAHQAIRSSGIGKMARREKGLADKVSAALILQSFMEKRLPGLTPPPAADQA